MYKEEAKRKQNIMLIGFMGAGKTSIGLKLSWKLRIPVEDTDKLIERQEGKTISEIFQTEGEEAFRRMETELLTKISKRPYRRIISVGGGTPVREENQKLLKRCGTVVFLRVRPETVCARLKGDTTRPLLQGENPVETIRSLMESRKEAYEACADIILDVDECSAEECAVKLATILGGEK